MNAILEERIRQGKTQKRLAYEAGIAARTLRKLERGEEVSLETLGAVRRALGIKTQPQPQIRPASSATLTSDEKESSESVWLRVCDWVTTTAIFVALTLTFCSLLGLMMFAMRLDATLTVIVEGECSAEKSEAVANKIENTLTGTQVLGKSSGFGTDGCELRLNLRTEETQAVAIEKLRAQGFRATFTGSRE
jgi:transcriptional regulator with XRE-family HTH domain